MSRAACVLHYNDISSAPDLMSAFYRHLVHHAACQCVWVASIRTRGSDNQMPDMSAWNTLTITWCMKMPCNSGA